MSSETKEQIGASPEGTGLLPEGETPSGFSSADADRDPSRMEGAWPRLPNLGRAHDGRAIRYDIPWIRDWRTITGRTIQEGMTAHNEALRNRARDERAEREDAKRLSPKDASPTDVVGAPDPIPSNGADAPGGGETPIRVRPLTGDALIEALAQHLHDEELDHKGNGWTWPEHPGDEGYRGRAWVSITPTDVQFECREAAARIARFFAARTERAPPPPQGTATSGDREAITRTIWQRLSALDLQDEIERYEFRAEEGDHVPTKDESAMLEDFANGLLGKVCELLAADALPPDNRAGLERVRHVKRGTEYEVLGEAEAQVSGITCPDGLGNGVLRNSSLLRDGDLLTVYRVPEGRLRCQLTDEFRDGRFVAIAATPPDNRAGGGIPDGWQPIKSAPKDGSDILLFGKMKGRDFPDRHIGKWFPVGSYGGGWWVSACVSVEATHWHRMPASPDPPEQSKGSGR